jgi:hypothetical protein
MSVRGRLLSVAEDHRVTTFELFFDLVFVFAVTQLTAYMADAHTAEGIVQATLLLALFWWSWSAYAWLGNQANAGVIVVVAFGVEEALAHAGDARGSGAFNAGALSFGAATYVFGSATFWFALERKIVWSRIVGAAALLAAWPVLAATRPLVGLAIVLAMLTAMAAVEVRARAPLN